MTLPAGTFVAGLVERLQTLFAQAAALLQAGYQRAPVLVLALGAVLLLPLIAVASFTIHRMARSKAREAAARAAARRAGTSGEWNGNDLAVRTIPAWTLQAWLTIEGRPNGTLPLAGQTIRIGRHQDNDIRLTDSSVHRYHAVIERTPEEEFIITDVSGSQGNGVRINGTRTERARLENGDVIELGRAKLRFENAPV